MARLFGLIGNRADLAQHALALEAPALRVAAEGRPTSWGVGFYQGGEVLMRRRPIDDRPSVEVDAVCGSVRADLLIGHVRFATAGGLRTENTHPFRYRQWLFAQTGSLGAFPELRERLLASIPDFLRGGVRGDTDSEVIFHLFMSFLHDRGHLAKQAPEPKVVADALRSTLALLDGMAAEVGEAPMQTNLLVANGESIVALHRGPPMGLRVLAGRHDAEEMIGDDLALRRRTPELDAVHFAIVASDFDASWIDAKRRDAAGRHWRLLEAPAIVTLARAAEPVIDRL